MGTQYLAEIQGFRPPLDRIVVDLADMNNVYHAIAVQYNESDMKGAFQFDLNIAAIDRTLQRVTHMAWQDLHDQEKAVRESGYTDEQWLANWRQSMLRFNTVKHLQPAVQDTILRDVIPQAAPEYFESQVTQSIRRDRLKLCAIGGLALLGGASFADGVQHPTEVMIPFINVAGLSLMWAPTTNREKQALRVCDKMIQHIHQENPDAIRLLQRAVHVRPKFDQP